MSTAQQDFEEIGALLNMVARRVSDIAQKQSETIKEQAERIAELEGALLIAENTNGLEPELIGEDNG